MESDRRIMPLFPLPIVQFPSAVTPLHIFEPRYRKLLKDVLAADKTFGIICRTEDADAGPDAPPLGRAGCAVEVLVAQELPDGRSNILCAGGRRFRTLRYVEGEPYLQAEVEFFDDEVSSESLNAEIARATRLFERVIEAGRRLKDAHGEELGPPELPQDPEALSFIVCAYLEIDVEEKQKLLDLTQTGERLRQAVAILGNVAKDFERRADVFEISRKNGHAGPVSEP
ncbi:MAG: LON peptidase substrate-binding domain-containing protein [Acidobacteria bacterium]|nr:LON peptidase substrate-binding domain-containing protein [Acidobacteriota bacterium]